MEKCPHCQNETIEAKKKLALSPKDVLLCPNCGAKLALESYAYFIHGIFTIIVALSITVFPVLIGVGAVILASIISLYLIIKIVPFKIIH